MSGANAGPSVQTYGTPQVLLDAIRAKFGIQQWDFDLACDSHNCIAPMGYKLDEGQDSLLQDWSELDGLNCFLNPPFGKGKLFAEKAAQARAVASRPQVFALFLASVGSSWFAKHVRPYASTHILTGRVTFIGCDKPFDRDLILAAYDGVEHTHPIEVWDWRAK
jgi:DNA N-6-adenine-methyltransferase Dam